MFNSNQEKLLDKLVKIMNRYSIKNKHSGEIIMGFSSYEKAKEWMGDQDLEDDYFIQDEDNSDVYPIKFASYITENLEAITLAFVKGINLDEISRHLLKEYKAHIKEIKFSQNSTFFRIYLENYEFTKAYKLRLTIEASLFSTFNAIRVSIHEVRRTWSTEKKPIEKNVIQIPVTYISPTTEAWNKFTKMVNDAKSLAHQEQ